MTAEDPKQTPNHCPYGCAQTDLNDVGYCRHLIGWSQDGKTFEMRTLVKGREVTRGVKVVDKADKLVSVPRGSMRVYRQSGNFGVPAEELETVGIGEVADKTPPFRDADAGED